MREASKTGKQLRYLKRRFGRTARATLFSEGRVNDSWKLELPTGESLVARFYPDSFTEKLRSETEALRAAKQLGMRVPSIIDIDTTGHETPLLLLSFIEGKPLTHRFPMAEKAIELFRELDRQLRLFSMYPTHACGYLHEISTESDRDCGAYVRSVLDSYLASAALQGICSDAEVLRYRSHLLELADELKGQPPQATYPDLSLGNLIVDAESNLSGIIDWDFIMGFDPDLAFANLFLEFPRRWQQALLRSYLGNTREKKVLQLALYRALELLSYLPSTSLYTESGLETRKNFLRCRIHEIESTLDSWESRIRKDGISVVVPTARTDAEFFLKTVCVSLDRFKGNKELILSPDRLISSDDDPLAGLVSAYPFVKLLSSTSGEGSAKTRMRAFKQAQYETILFTDDDCIVPENWCEDMYEEVGRSGVVAGNLLAIDAENPYSRVDAYVDQLRIRSKHLDSFKYVSFPNFGIRYSLLPDPPFTASARNTVEDIELACLLQLEGKNIAFREAITVRTAYPESLSSLLRRKRKHAKGVAWLFASLTPAERVYLGLSESTHAMFWRWIRLSVTAPLTVYERSCMVLSSIAYSAGVYLHKQH